MNSLLINLSCILNQPTGISNYAFNLFPYLHPLNPTLLSCRNFDNFNCYSIPNNLTSEKGSLGHFRRLIWTQFQLPKIYQDLQSSLLFSPLPEAPLWNNCNYIVMVHDVIPLRFPNFSSPLFAYFKYYIPIILSQATHLICNSTATAKDITNFYGISPSKITPILLSYNSSIFRFLNLQLAETPYFLYIGRQDPHKNVNRLITSFSNLPKSWEYELWIVGPTDSRYTPTLKKQADELGLGHKIKFLGYLPDEELAKLMNSAVALVFPSLWEGFGLPVLEAMACGTPVITSNLSSLPEVTGDAALLVNPYNIEEMTEAMRNIAQDSQLRSHLHSLSLQRASQFSWAKTGQKTMEVLQQYL